MAAKPRRISRETRQKFDADAARCLRKVARIPRLDKEMREIVAGLWMHGFDTTYCCIGHEENAKEPDTRFFFPYVIVGGGNDRLLDRLDGLVLEFCYHHNPFNSTKNYVNFMDLRVHPENLYGASPLEKQRSRELRSHVTIADCSALLMAQLPREMLTSEIRLAYLRRTQSEMLLFGKFLWWKLEEKLKFPQ